VRWALRIALPLVVVAAALAVGAAGSDAPSSDAERASAVAGSVRCPTCAGQSVASSDAPAAGQIKAEIERRVAEGESDDEIRAALVRSYGEGILLNPPSSGVAGLVWAVPVAAVVVALAGLAVALRRWRPAVPAPATDDDRLLVAEARRRLVADPDR
jgi:cytochrome c-type biogenesis protein CcmH/NrfF